EEKCRLGLNQPGGHTNNAVVGTNLFPKGVVMFCRCKKVATGVLVCGLCGLAVFDHGMAGPTSPGQGHAPEEGGVPPHRGVGPVHMSAATNTTGQSAAFSIDSQTFFKIGHEGKLPGA